MTEASQVLMGAPSERSNLSARRAVFWAMSSGLSPPETRARARESSHASSSPSVVLEAVIEEGWGVRPPTVHRARTRERDPHVLAYETVVAADCPVPSAWKPLLRPGQRRRFLASKARR